MLGVRECTGISVSPEQPEKKLRIGILAIVPALQTVAIIGRKVAEQIVVHRGRHSARLLIGVAKAENLVNERETNLVVSQPVVFFPRYDFINEVDCPYGLVETIRARVLGVSGLTVDSTIVKIKETLSIRCSEGENAIRQAFQ